MKTKNNSLTIIHREVNQAMKNVAFNYKITAYQRKEFLILRLYILNNLNLRNTNLNVFRLFIKVVQFAGSLRSDMGAV